MESYKRKGGSGNDIPLWWLWHGKTVESLPTTNQYNGYMRGQQAFNQPQQMINCRPVSSYDEAKASMIDLDGSLFVFTDVANKKIYTKQIMLDGTAELKTYVLENNQNKMQEQQAQQNNMYVLRTDFEDVIKSMKQRIEELGGGVLNEPVGNDV